MSIYDNPEKINPVVNFGNAQSAKKGFFAKIYYGVKQFVTSDQGKDFVVLIIFILANIGSFELGRLSKAHQNPGLKIEYSEAMARGKVLGVQNNEQEMSQKGSTNSSGNFFASSRGQKYYPRGCSAGDSIKTENRVYFQTREEAEGAGYELSSSCR